MGRARSLSAFVFCGRSSVSICSSRPSALWFETTHWWTRLAELEHGR